MIGFSVLICITAADGQQIYLHALNARCLVKEYGGLEYSPDTVTADIVEIENIFMSEVCKWIYNWIDLKTIRK